MSWALIELSRKHTYYAIKTLLEVYMASEQFLGRVKIT